MAGVLAGSALACLPVVFPNTYGSPVVNQDRASDARLSDEHRPGGIRGFPRASEAVNALY